jgi:hypothetical protein
MRRSHEFCRRREQTTLRAEIANRRVLGHNITPNVTPTILAAVEDDLPLGLILWIDDI